MAKIDYLAKAKEYAKSRGGECLATEYRNSRTQMKWKCSNLEHHEWLNTYQTTVNNDKWCPKCAGKLSLQEYLEKAKIHAITKGGECLSIDYKNATTTMLWRCSQKNHSDWSANYNQIINQKNWCPECAGNIYNPEKSLIKLQKYALIQGGECLATEYKNSNTKMSWKCSHKLHNSWLASYKTILDGHWCPNVQILYIIKKIKLEFYLTIY